MLEILLVVALSFMVFGGRNYLGHDGAIESLLGSAHGSHMCVHVLEGSARVSESHVVH